MAKKRLTKSVSKVHATHKITKGEELELLPSVLVCLVLPYCSADRLLQAVSSAMAAPAGLYRMTPDASVQKLRWPVWPTAWGMPVIK